MTWTPELQRAYRYQKARLTRAQHSGKPQNVLTAVAAFYAYYDGCGAPLPDNWSRWERAKADASHVLWSRR